MCDHFRYSIQREVVFLFLKQGFPEGKLDTLMALEFQIEGLESVIWVLKPSHVSFSD